MGSRRGAGGRRAALALACAALGSLLSLSLFLVTPARAQLVRYVDDDVGCDGQRPCYQSIQGAVDAADDGDVLSVAPGLYDESILVVDKALVFEGRGAGRADTPWDAASDAVVTGRANGDFGTALTIDARTGDVTGTRVSGLRFVSATVGVQLVGRRAGDPFPVPPDMPTSTIDTAITDTLISGNVFTDVGHPSATVPGAVVATWADDLHLTDNEVRGGEGGFALVGGSQVEVRGNELTGVGGSSIAARLHGAGLDVVDNTIVDAAGRGIEIRALAVPGGFMGTGGGVRMTGNEITGALGEAMVIDVTDGGVITDVDVRQARVTDTGTGGDASFRGAIVLAGRDEALGAIALREVEVRGTVRPTGSDAVAAGVFAAEVHGTVGITDSVVADGEGTGVHLVDMRRVRIQGSTVTGHAEGIRLVESHAAAAGGGDIVVGGAPALGNRLGGNRGPALVLENDTGTSVSTSDVLATHNDWDTAYAPAIEDIVHHRPDNVVLGLVAYTPMLGAPEQARVSVEPASLVADGASEAIVTLEADDPAGEPVADGTLVRFGTDQGTLSRAGADAEAEDEGGALVLFGEWGRFDSEVFGPFSGSGYVRSYQPGSHLSWTFEAPAVLVRYGQSLLNDGTFRVQIDGLDAGMVSTRGPAKSWVDRVLAEGLRPGPHTITLTVESGEINIDRLTSGATTVDGRANARLQAGNRVGVARVAGVAHGSAGERSATADVPFTAGRPAVLTMAVDTPMLPVGGVTTTVTVDAHDDLGRPVPDGTLIGFSTTRGQISPAQSVTVRGVARATLRSGLDIGPGSVRAESGAAFVTRPFTVTAGPPALIGIAASRTTLPANSRSTAEITVNIEDSFGHPVVDGTPVMLSTSLGRLDDPVASTVDGSVRTVLRAEDTTGEAVVRASAGGQTGQIALTFIGTDLRLTKNAEPQSAVVPGERVTFTLGYANVGSGAVYDVLIEDLLPTGLISPVIQTSPNQQLSRLPDRPLAFTKDRLGPGEQGTITVVLKVDTSLRWGQRSVVDNQASAFADRAAELTPGDNSAVADVVVVSGDVYSVTLSAFESVSVGGATGTVRATLTDRFGNPARDGTVVAFSTDLGTVSPLLATTTNGEAQATFASGTRAGWATIRALSVDERGATARVRVLPGPPHRLALASAHPALAVGGETTVVTATVTDQYANGIGAERVTFDTDQGLLSIEEAHTTGTGVATTTLRSAVRAGTARVEARSGRFADTLALPFRAGPAAGISLQLQPDRIGLGETAEATARVEDVFGNPVVDTPVTFRTTVGVVQRGEVATDPRGEARTAVYGSRAGSGVVRASVASWTDTRSLAVVPNRAYVPIAVNPRR